MLVKLVYLRDERHVCVRTSIENWHVLPGSHARLIHNDTIWFPQTSLNHAYTLKGVINYRREGLNVSVLRYYVRKSTVTSC